LKNEKANAVLCLVFLHCGALTPLFFFGFFRKKNQTKAASKRRSPKKTKPQCGRDYTAGRDDKAKRKAKKSQVMGRADGLTVVAS
jgi:hypothetical protein